MLKAKIELEQLTSENIKKLIDKFMESAEYAWFLKAQRYYEGYHDILARETASSNTGGENKLVNNYPGYIVDVNIGYFVGKPISYTSPDEQAEYLEDLQDVFDYNDEQDQNSILAKTCAIKGRVYELLYMSNDEKPQVSFAPIQPENMILVYDTLVAPAPIFAIRFWHVFDILEDSDDEGTLYADLYTPEKIIHFEGDGDSLTQKEEENNPFGEVPIIEYINNDERQGDFDKVISLIDAYDKGQSDTANDFESFADAFLKVRNMSGTDDNDIAEMRKKRVILLDDDGEADWLVKEVNDAAQENYKTRLSENIHTFSLTPALTDDKFAGNITGVALQYKMWGLEQKASQKERKFKKSLQRRIELISAIESIRARDWDWRDISIIFTRNSPPVLTELVKMVTELRDFLSDESLYSLLPFVDNPAEEAERLQRQRGESVDLDKFENPLRKTGFITEEEEEKEVIEDGDS